MRPLSVRIERNVSGPLDIEEAEYVFGTLLTTAGFPHNFVRPPKDGPTDIYYGTQAPSGVKLFIKMDLIERQTIKAPVKVTKSGDLTLFSFKAETGETALAPDHRGGWVVGNDIILSTFYLLSGWQEGRIPRRRHDRHCVKDSFLYRNRLLHDPLVNTYAMWLRQIFEKDCPPIPQWPFGKKYAVALIHDIDYPEMIAWIECLRYLVARGREAKLDKAAGILAGRESFWRFDDVVRREEERRLKSAFYFCGFKGSLLRYLFRSPDPFYDVRKRKFRMMMRKLAGGGFEIGMHGSFRAYRSEGLMREEKHVVEQALGSPVYGNTQHHWHMNPENPADTALHCERIGLVYDSSLGFEQRAGFRYGICSPFHLYDSAHRRPLKILELPPALMDHHLFAQARYGYLGGWRNEIDAIVDAVRKLGGVLAVSYHPRVFNDTLFPGWGSSYEYLLDRISLTPDFYCDTPAVIARHWLAREEKIQAASSAGS